MVSGLNAETRLIRYKSYKIQCSCFTWWRPGLKSWILFRGANGFEAMWCLHLWPQHPKETKDILKIGLYPSGQEYTHLGCHLGIAYPVLKRLNKTPEKRHTCLSTYIQPSCPSRPSNTTSRWPQRTKLLLLTSHFTASGFVISGLLEGRGCW